MKRAKKAERDEIFECCVDKNDEKKLKYDGFFTIFFHELTEIMGGGT